MWPGPGYNSTVQSTMSWDGHIGDQSRGTIHWLFFPSTFTAISQSGTRFFSKSSILHPREFVSLWPFPVSTWHNIFWHWAKPRLLCPGTVRSVYLHYDTEHPGFPLVPHQFRFRGLDLFRLTVYLILPLQLNPKHVCSESPPDIVPMFACYLSAHWLDSHLSEINKARWKLGEAAK